MGQYHGNGFLLITTPLIAFPTPEYDEVLSQKTMKN